MLGVTGVPGGGTGSRILREGRGRTGNGSLEIDLGYGVALSPGVGKGGKVASRMGPW